MDLKHALRKVEPGRDNLRHDPPSLWILTVPPLHSDAVGGRSQHQSLLVVSILLFFRICRSDKHYKSEHYI